MPKEMFYKIKKEKQDKIINAAMSELTSKAFKDVSILSISKLAEISRGSFYNYFDTVGEILEYLVELLKEERQVYAPEIFKKSNKDIFEFVKNLIKYDYDTYMDKSNYSLLNNYLQYLSESNKSFREFFFNNILESVLKLGNGELIDFDNFKVTEDEFFLALELLGNSIARILISGKEKDLGKEEIFKTLDFTVDLIKSGLRNYTK